MKVLFHTHLAAEFPDRIERFASEFPMHEIAVAGSRTELFEGIRGSDVLVDYRATGELLERAARLRWLFVPFTGVDRIPWDLLRPRGIGVCLNHGNARIVAERALALALALMGRVPEFDRGLRRGYWFRNQDENQPFTYWESLADKPAAILGTGAIGRHIADFLLPFTRDIVGFCRSPEKPAPPGFRRITGNLHESLRGARLCFVALPLTAQTASLLGAREFEILGRAYLVNVSRGAVIDENAMYRALRSGRLAGAALDVWHQYPEVFHEERLPSRHPFHELDNVVLSPHAGSHAPEGKIGQLEGTLLNLRALFETGSPRDIADPDKGY